MKHVDEFVPQNSRLQYITYDEEIRQWNPSFSILIGTSWFYKLMSTSFLAVYLPWADSGFIAPWIFEIHAKDPKYPQSKKLIWIDKKSYFIYYALA
jgi:hypothetical protein